MSFNRIEIFDFLLKCGTDLNEINTIDLFILLNFAVMSNNIKATKLLLEKYKAPITHETEILAEFYSSEEIKRIIQETKNKYPKDDKSNFYFNDQIPPLPQIGIYSTKLQQAAWIKSEKFE